jgi:hypothetical protein
LDLLKAIIKELLIQKHTSSYYLKRICSILKKDLSHLHSKDKEMDHNWDQTLKVDLHSWNSHRVRILLMNKDQSLSLKQDINKMVIQGQWLLPKIQNNKPFFLQGGINLQQEVLVATNK